nr:MAG TPA: hypothetical protein [Caudoviricetes sp.]
MAESYLLHFLLSLGRALNRNRFGRNLEVEKRMQFTAHPITRSSGKHLM